ncbi:kinase-like domain-containing protein [Hypoxylon sp. FL1857]|nr:kinase-like domain-containing protein [Hypoxylon sp. FL1857]
MSATEFPQVQIMSSDGNSGVNTPNSSLSGKGHDAVIEIEDIIKNLDISADQYGNYAPRDPLESCVACGWTPEEHADEDYRSNITLFNVYGARGVWKLGSKYVLKDTPASSPTYEAANLRFLKENSDIPIPTVIHDWIDSGRYFIMTSRIEGITLEQAWPSLSEDGKNRIARQAGEQLEKLRKLTSPRIEGVDGKPFSEPSLSCKLFPGATFGQHSISSDEELWNEIEKPLARVSGETRVQMRASMPQCGPYTFTHGDLSCSNIMVKDGNFSGFLGFQGSGFLPVWYEYVSCRFAVGMIDMEWKQLLSAHITRYPQAMLFHMARLGFMKDPTSTQALRYLNRIPDDAPMCPMVQVEAINLTPTDE